jgi:hypothetical protein
VGNERAALAVNLGAEGWWKSKRGSAEPNEFVVIVKVCEDCLYWLCKTIECWFVWLNCI